MDISTYLERTGLMQYKQNLSKNGVLTVSDLLCTSFKMMVDMNISPPHACALLSGLDDAVSPEPGSERTLPSDLITIQTPDGFSFTLNKTVAASQSEYFREIIASKQPSNNCIKTHVLGRDFSLIYDMLVYPVRSLSDTVATDISSHEVNKLIHNAQYFKVDQWIPAVLQNTNSCCKAALGDPQKCHSCGKLHLCNAACAVCQKLTCSKCLTSCASCLQTHCDKLCVCKPLRVINESPVAVLKGHSEAVNSVSFSHNSKLLLTCGDDNIIVLWDAVTGERMRSFIGHTNSVYAARFSYNDDQAASGSYDRTIRLWDVKTGRQLLTLESHAGAVLSLAFSRGKAPLLASAGYDCSARLWNPETGDHLRSLWHEKVVWNVAFSTNKTSTHLATACDDKLIHIWDTSKWCRVRTLEGHTNSVLDISFSPDNTYLASASHDKTVRVWNPKTGTLKKVFKSHNDLVRSVSFSSSGTYLASGGYDKVVHIHEVRSEKLIGTLHNHTDHVRCVSFSPNGAAIASAGSDNITFVYSLVK
eukprot:TRINITY_DN6250_c1_g1_i1.p1 TRINITY_DN6250_c1_g1~~TRINITY_DN6250_c1_g1_i1.p1  ORF type:complete len:531 (+),score=59.12 TRINITY_DN6250_c1_g1_i1:537-2129(+)